MILGGNGIANRTLQFLGITDEPADPDLHPAGGMMGMVYSYLPFMILPLYAALEKFDIAPEGGGPGPRGEPVAHVLAGHVPA